MYEMFINLNDHKGVNFEITALFIVDITQLLTKYKYNKLPATTVNI